MAILALG